MPPKGRRTARKAVVSPRTCKTDVGQPDRRETADVGTAKRLHRLSELLRLSAAPSPLVSDKSSPHRDGEWSGAGVEGSSQPRDVKASTRPVVSFAANHEMPWQDDPLFDALPRLIHALFVVSRIEKAQVRVPVRSKDAVATATAITTSAAGAALRSDSPEAGLWAGRIGDAERHRGAGGEPPPLLGDGVIRTLDLGAQRKAHVDDSIGLSTNRVASAPATTAHFSPLHLRPPVCSVFADQRWLAAVSRYSGMTFSLDELAKLAVAFSEWIDVSWHARASPFRFGVGSEPPAYAVEAPGVRSGALSSSCPHSGYQKPNQSSGNELDWPIGVGLSGASLYSRQGIGALLPRIALLREDVPSQECAVMFLREKLANLASAAPSSSGGEPRGAGHCLVREFLARVRGVTAASAVGGSAALLLEGPSATTAALGVKRPRSSQDDSVVEAGEVGEDVVAASRGRSHCDILPSAHGPLIPVTADVRAASTAAAATGGDIAACLSEQLRHSLPKEKLEAVLAHIRREELRVLNNDEACLRRRQEREKLLALYDLIRAVFAQQWKSRVAHNFRVHQPSAPRASLVGRELGTIVTFDSLSDDVLLNAQTLLDILVAQNRYGDGAERIREQLHHLMSLKRSGLSAERVSATRTESAASSLGSFTGEVDGVAPQGPVFSTEALSASSLRNVDPRNVLLRLSPRNSCRHELAASIEAEEATEHHRARVGGSSS